MKIRMHDMSYPAIQGRTSSTFSIYEKTLNGLPFLFFSQTNIMKAAITRDGRTLPRGIGSLGIGPAHVLIEVVR